MLPRLAFDIETEPDPDAVSSMPAPEVATGNLKDPAKIAEKVADARARQLSRAALHPHYGRILAIGTARRDGDRIVTNVALRDDTRGQDSGETALLNFFWQEVFSAKWIASFNGCGFDVPFLKRRSVLLDVPTCSIEIDRYRVLDPLHANHLDVRFCLDRWEIGNGQGDPLSLSHDLDYYAGALLGETAPHLDVDKSNLGVLSKTEPGRQVIRELCGWDVSVTLRLAEIAARFYA